MAGRKKVGLLFLYGEGWAGGFYYLLNIVNSLNSLPDDQKPELVVFYGTASLKKVIESIGYPYVKILPFSKPSSIVEKAYNKVARFITKDLQYIRQYPADIVDFAFPCDYNGHVFLGSLRKVRIIYWIPDFQHKHLPHFFEKEEIEKRDKNINAIAVKNIELVLSSEDAKADFLKYYPTNNAIIHVNSFASVLPDFSHVKMEDLILRYKVSTPYFISPNQFWIHKNHIILLKAVALLKNKNYQYQVIFTGKEDDYRNPDYFSSLKTFVKENAIENYIKFLGFIDRADQLQLMKHSLAVVQPSLFEGWSTVVEDSKAMNQTLVLSSLSVHKEQCGENAIYFDPKNEYELAEKLEKCLIKKVSFPEYNYQQKILNYANAIINL